MLFLVSVRPKDPLRESGAWYWAMKVFVGPMRSLQCLIALLWAMMWIWIGPLEIDKLWTWWIGSFLTLGIPWHESYEAVIKEPLIVFMIEPFSIWLLKAHFFASDKGETSWQHFPSYFLLILFLKCLICKCQIYLKITRNFNNVWF